MMGAPKGQQWPRHRPLATATAWCVRARSRDAKRPGEGGAAAKGTQQESDV